MAAELTITKDMIIGDILEIEDGKHIQGIAKYFFEIGMHCLGCPSARGETLEQACEVHGQDADMLLGKINAYLAEQSA
jgi:hybrid cluster-associated redox disulfide protein